MSLTSLGTPLMPVNSRSIRAAGYDGYTLAVLFHTSDTIYEHRGVPYAVYVEFMTAPSKGAHYTRFIRGKYH